MKIRTLLEKNIFFVFAILYSIFFHFRVLIKSYFIKEINNKEFDNFLLKNITYWRKNKKALNNKKILLTSFVHHPGYTLTESIISKNTQDYSNFDIVGLLDENDNFSKKLVQSFNIDTFTNYPKISFFQRLIFLFEAYKIIITLKNFQDFINYSSEDISYGKPVYDHIIRMTGKCSHTKVNYKFYFFLAEALFCNNFSKNFFSTSSFEYMVMSENQFLPSNIIFQNALKFKVKVLSRIQGPKKIGLRLYSSLEEKGQTNIKIAKKIINKIFDLNRKLYSEKGLKSLLDLYEGKTPHYDQNSRNLFLERNNNTVEDLYKALGWNKSKNICVLFSHNLFDGNYNTEWRIFRDNLEWLRETLKFIKTLNSNINWIIKEHPSDYGSGRHTTSTYKEFKNIIGFKENIKFFPKNFDTSLIKEVTSCVLTSQGSAGLEYPCFGIPSIIAGDAHYQGFGFTIEPKNKDEYFEKIEDMHNITSKGLNDEQIDLARINYCILEELSKVDHPLLYNFDISKNLNFNEFFKKSSDLLSNYNEKEDLFKKSLIKQLTENERHLINI